MNFFKKNNNRRTYTELEYIDKLLCWSCQMSADTYYRPAVDIPKRVMVQDTLYCCISLMNSYNFVYTFTRLLSFRYRYFPSAQCGNMFSTYPCTLWEPSLFINKFVVSRDWVRNGRLPFPVKMSKQTHVFIASL